MNVPKMKPRTMAGILSEYPEVGRALGPRAFSENALFLFDRIGNHFKLQLRVEPQFFGARFQEIRSRQWVIFLGKNQEFVFLREKRRELILALDAYWTLGIDAKLKLDNGSMCLQRSTQPF